MTNSATPARRQVLHPHALVLKHMPREYYEYESAVLQWNTIDPYDAVQKIGRGKYGEVFRGRNRENDEVCVLKVLKPVRQKKISREITILQHLFGGPNVIKLLDIAQEPKNEIPILVFENVDNFDYRVLYPRLTSRDVRFYIFEILKTLDFCHSMGIMHRDIKPQNIMIDPCNRKLRVIDWGLAEYYIHEESYNVRVASRHYKGPELLVGYRYYDYSLDMWSLGCVLGSILFRRDPLFRGSDNNDQLWQIVNVLGSEGLVRYINKYKISSFPQDFNRDILTTRTSRRSWTSMVTPATQHLCSTSALDLLDRMLRYDHEERITPKEAMTHAFFDAVRVECLSYVSTGGIT